MKRTGIFLVPVVAVTSLALAGCTEPATPDSTSSPTPSATASPGVSLQGWPATSYDCTATPADGRQTTRRRFEYVDELLVCRSTKAGTSQRRLGLDDDGFDQVMRALHAMKEPKDPLFCPYLTTPDRRTIQVMASDPDGGYFVDITFGYCGTVPPDVAKAFDQAGIGVAGATLAPLNVR